MTGFRASLESIEPVWNNISNYHNISVIHEVISGKLKVGRKVSSKRKKTFPGDVSEQAGSSKLWHNISNKWLGKVLKINDADSNNFLERGEKLQWH